MENQILKHLMTNGGKNIRWALDRVSDLQPNNVQATSTQSLPSHQRCYYLVDSDEAEPSEIIPVTWTGTVSSIKPSASVWVASLPSQTGVQIVALVRAAALPCPLCQGESSGLWAL